MSNPIMIEVPKEVARKAKIFLFSVLLVGLFIMLISAGFYSSGDTYTANIIISVGFILMLIGVVSYMIILFVANQKMERKRDPYQYDHRYNKDAMPKGAKIAVLVMVVVFFIAMIIVAVS